MKIEKQAKVEKQDNIEYQILYQDRQQFNTLIFPTHFNKDTIESAI